MTEQKLTELGFLEVYSHTIRLTGQRMHAQIAADPYLADRVFDLIRDALYPFPVHADNYDQLLANWVKEQADALHRERAKALIAPFRLIANLF